MERRDRMDTQTVFKLIKNLTSQTNVHDLVLALAERLAENFSGVQLVVYELQATRTDYSKSQSLICLDCLARQDPCYLNDDQDFYRAYLTKEDVTNTLNPQQTSMILPVVLYDQSVSHLIKVIHPYQEQAAIDTLDGLLQIFKDIFRNLHEKGYDPLTRILNRQAFDQVTSDLVYAPKVPKSFNAFSNKKFKAIAILDIDKFKTINDRFGHAIGDETLVLFAQTIRMVLRREDLFFRYGGEEFVVLVKEVDNEQAQNVLERCREAIESRRFPQVGEVTVSIGFADLAPKAHPVEVLSKADKALYFVKKHGRNQVRSYEQLVAEGMLQAAEPIGGSADFWD